MNKSYIGDSVYADIDERTGDLVLTTENGFDPSNTIVLEQQVLTQLLEYCVRHELIRLTKSSE